MLSKSIKKIPKKKVKKVKTRDSMWKRNFFLSTVLSSLWVVLATWLHVVGAPQKIEEEGN
jgi:hypothetical protein